jgi:glycosyltransferase 2 family protein
MRFGWRGALGVIISAGALYWALRGVHFSEVAAHLRRANVPLLLLSAVTATAIFPLRARRWRPILDPVAPGLAFVELWRPTAIGMMVSNLFPARAGEPARAFALTRETDRVPFSTAFASVAVDRVFDAAIVLLLMAGATLDPRFAPGAVVFGQPVSKVMLSGVVFAAAVMAVLYALVFMPHRIMAAWSWLARHTVRRWDERGRSMISSFARGLEVLRSPGRFAAVFGWALLHWLVNALAFWIAFQAVGIEAPFTAALFLQGLISIGVALPAAPGFFGLFELFGTAGLALYGVPRDLAVTWAITFHLLSFIPITVMGGYYFVHLGLRLADVRAAKARTEQEPPPSR